MKIASQIGLKPESDTFNPVIVDFYRDVGYLTMGNRQLPDASWLVAG